MNNEFQAMDFIIYKMFDFIDYFYKKIYENKEKKEVNIELGNLYTIYEDDDPIENNYSSNL
tara:strand:+ start:240 stop:422 length:183 start_codon:yes stop_codon:yes gene_type:complete